MKVNSGLLFQQQCPRNNNCEKARDVREVAGSRAQTRLLVLCALVINHKLLYLDTAAATGEPQKKDTRASAKLHATNNINNNVGRERGRPSDYIQADDQLTRHLHQPFDPQSAAPHRRQPKRSPSSSRRRCCCGMLHCLELIGSPPRSELPMICGLSHLSSGMLPQPNPRCIATCCVLARSYGRCFVRSTNALDPSSWR